MYTAVGVVDSCRNIGSFVAGGCLSPEQSLLQSKGMWESQVLGEAMCT